MGLTQFESTSCEEVDACVFTGDVTLRPEAREQFKKYVERWTRAIEAAEGNEIRDALEAAALACADKAEAELERVSKDAERWFKVWELDLVLHRLERGWWCTRISMDHDTIEYPPRATREEAIDAAIEQEKKNA